MTSSNDSTPQLKWFDRDPFYSKLYEVHPGDPRNKTAAVVSYADGEFTVIVPTRKNVHFEIQIREMCKQKKEVMRIGIAKWVAKKLT